MAITLSANEIYAALTNMIISEQTFAENIKGASTKLVDRNRVDGSLFGDTKVYVSTNILKSHAWGNDSEATNLLAIDRGPAPKVQTIVLNVFRQIRLTTDSYLTKRAWQNSGSYAQFIAVMKTQLSDTRKVYDLTTYNVYIGTTETNKGKQTKTITLPEQALGVYYDTTEEEFLEGGSDLEKTARLEAQKVAQTIADILNEMEDVSKDYNDNGFVRAYDVNDLEFVWNTAWLNKLTKFDLPTIFNNSPLKDRFDEFKLQPRYFGNVNDTTVTVADGLTIRSTIEQEVTVATQFTDADGIVYAVGSKFHVFAGDLIPDDTVLVSNGAIVVPSYTEDANIICKIKHKDGVPYMSAFETMTDFWNPRSLTDTQFLTFGRNELSYLKNFPLVTIKQSSGS